MSKLWLARVATAAALTAAIVGGRFAFRQLPEGGGWWIAAASVVVFPLLLVAEVLADRRESSHE